MWWLVMNLICLVVCGVMLKLCRLVLSRYVMIL